MDLQCRQIAIKRSEAYFLYFIVSFKPEYLKFAKCIFLIFCEQIFISLYVPENSVSTQRKSASLIAFSTSGRTDEKSKKSNISEILL